MSLLANICLIAGLLVNPESSIIYKNDLGTVVEALSESRSWDDDFTIELSITVDRSGQYVLSTKDWNDRYVDFFDLNKKLICFQCREVSVNLKSGSNIFYGRFIPVRNIGIRSIMFRVQAVDVYYKEDNLRVASQAVFSAVLILLMIYGFIYYFQTKHWLGLHYAMYLLANILFFLATETRVYETMNLARLIPPVYIWILSNLITAAYLLFIRSFLGILPGTKVYRILNWSIVFEVSIFVFELLMELIKVDVQHMEFYKISILGAEILLAAYIIYHVVMLKTFLSRLLILGSLVLGATSIGMQVVMAYGLWDYYSFFPFIMQGGILLELIIFSLGIGVHVGMINEARQKAQGELIQQLRENENLQQSNTKKLEKRVHERTEALQQKVDENELLVKEIHHRTKNNLQMITSLLNMQRRRVNESPSLDILNETKNRVSSISLLHEHLYSHDNLSSIEIKPYVENLVGMLKKSIMSDDQVSFEVKSDLITTEMEIALNIGLILNELITNSLKYAFASTKNPFISIQIEQLEKNIRLTVTDNGLGANKFDKGLGWTIIDNLVKGMDGQVLIINENGTRIVITLNPHSTLAKKS